MPSSTSRCADTRSNSASPLLPAPSADQISPSAKDPIAAPNSAASTTQYARSTLMRHIRHRTQRDCSYSCSRPISALPRAQILAIVQAYALDNSESNNLSHHPEISQKLTSKARLRSIGRTFRPRLSPNYTYPYVTLRARSNPPLHPRSYYRIHCADPASPFGFIALLVCTG